MSTVNEQLRDRLILHDIGLARLQASTVRKILGLLSTAERDLERQIRQRLGWIAARGYDASDFTLRRLEANLQEIRRALRQAYIAAGKELRKDLVALADSEAASQSRLLIGSLPPSIEMRVSVVTPAAAELRAIVESRPFQGALLKDWARQLEVSAYQKVRGAIRQGLLQGESIDGIVRRIRGTRRNRWRDGILELTRREAETVVRTAVSHVAQSVRDDTYQANADLIRSIVWLGTLDSRTCTICAPRDGREYTLDKKPLGHSIPWGAGPGRMHHRDRCTSVPRLKSWRELGIDRDELSAGTRASMNGQVPESTTFGDWIERQPAAVQNQVLGVTRARALRRGEARFVDFFDRRGNLKGVLGASQPSSGPPSRGTPPPATQPTAAPAAAPRGLGLDGLSDAAAAELTRHETRIRPLAIEHAAVVDRDGNTLVEQTSNHASMVSFTPDQLARARGNVLTHNHPRGSAFSSADLALWAARDVGEIRAVGRLANGAEVTYRLREGSQARPGARELVREWNAAEARLWSTYHDEVDRRVNAGEARDEVILDVWQRHSHEILESVAAAFPDQVVYERVVGDLP